MVFVYFFGHSHSGLDDLSTLVRTRWWYRQNGFRLYEQFDAAHRSRQAMYSKWNRSPIIHLSFHKMDLPSSLEPHESLTNQGYGRTACQKHAGCPPGGQCGLWRSVYWSGALDTLNRRFEPTLHSGSAARHHTIRQGSLPVRQRRCAKGVRWRGYGSHLSPYPRSRWDLLAPDQSQDRDCNAHGWEQRTHERLCRSASTLPGGLGPSPDNCRSSLSRRRRRNQ